MPGLFTGLNSSQGNSYYKNRQLGVDILNISFNQFENYRQKNLLLDMEPYMAEALALQEVLMRKQICRRMKEKAFMGSQSR